MAIPALQPCEEVTLAKMTAGAYEALQACQPPTWAEYFKMSWLERDAVSAARRILQAEAAQRMGLANTGPLGAALAGSDGDGGAAAEAVFLAQQTAQALVNIKAEAEHVPR